MANAFVQTDLAGGADANLLFTAVASGAPGIGITIRYVGAGGSLRSDTDLLNKIITVSGIDTGASALQVKQHIEDDEHAMLLITVALVGPDGDVFVTEGEWVTGGITIVTYLWHVGTIIILSESGSGAAHDSEPDGDQNTADFTFVAEQVQDDLFASDGCVPASLLLKRVDAETVQYSLLNVEEY